jgi:Lon protease-like protein
MSDDPTSLTALHGQVRLFPLPNLVLFPSVVQPLHVFEPRYRQLMVDALAEDRLIAMALLQPGWEDDYHKRPPIYPGVCIGRIFKEEKLEDGRFNLLLQGAARARVLEELPADKLYRVARVELVHDQPVAHDATERRLRKQLGEALEGWFASQDAAQEQLRKLLQSQLPLGTLCDLFSFTLPLPVLFKQQLLEEPRAVRRADRLLQHLQESDAEAEPGTTSQRFPPDFSPN